MKSIRVYLKQLLESGNRASSARFFMLGTLLIALALYVIIAFILLYDVLTDGVVDTSLDGLSNLIQAISINLGIGGLTKVLSRAKVNEKD